MADKQLNKVNEQITDSITQVNTKVLADTPAMAMGNFYTALGLSLSNAGNNATSAQQNANIMAQAATVQGVNCLLYTSPSPRDRQKSRMPSSA